MVGIVGSATPTSYPLKNDIHSAECVLVISCWVGGQGGVHKCSAGCFFFLPLRNIRLFTVVKDQFLEGICNSITVSEIPLL